MSPKTHGFPYIYREPGGSLPPVVAHLFGSHRDEFDGQMMDLGATLSVPMALSTSPPCAAACDRASPLMAIGRAFGPRSGSHHDGAIH
jgi:hypothetical protein